VNPHSNYCFGEGGAGTYSDGKLYTRSHKRGKIIKVLKLLVEHGANPDILVDAHPHIGSNKLPAVVAAIRETILSHGGEVHFSAHVTGLKIREKKIDHLVINEEKEVKSNTVILATGHSARDVYFLLQNEGVEMQFKPFALGVRIEHQQGFIDQVQYHSKTRDPYLPPASYKLACQVDGHGVFSFCMCPGGLIVPASTAPGEIVINGMSLSRRDSTFANAGTVVSVDMQDLLSYVKDKNDPLVGMRFQSMVEHDVFQSGDGSQRAPAQRLVDFVENRHSKDLPDSSYIPGLHTFPLDRLLPEFVTKFLRQGIIRFGEMMPGYLTNDAVVVATESRTSSPVRIPRDPITMMHTHIEGLFPCGEGAGYAGGIVSAAMDGQNVARAVGKFMESYLLRS
jgi:uncharacterized FAD-dependent dehydrogenase